MDAGFPIFASCWPRGTTSDQPVPAVFGIFKEERMFKKSLAGDMAPAPLPWPCGRSAYLPSECSRNNWAI